MLSTVSSAPDVTLDAVTTVTDGITMTTGFYTSVVVTDASNPVPPEITVTDAFTVATSSVTMATSTTPPLTIATSETTFLVSPASTAIQKPASSTLDAVSPVSPVIATDNAATVVTNAADAATETNANGKAPDIDAVAPATEIPVTTVTNGNAATTNAPANDAVASIDPVTSATNTAAIPATDAAANAAEVFTQTRVIESNEIQPVPDGPGEVVTDFPPTFFPAFTTNSPAIAPEVAVPVSPTIVPVPDAAPQPELDVKTDSKPPSGVEERNEGPSAETKEEKTPTNSESKDKDAEAPGITVLLLNSQLPDSVRNNALILHYYNGKC